MLLKYSRDLPQVIVVSRPLHQLGLQLLIPETHTIDRLPLNQTFLLQPIP